MLLQINCDSFSFKYGCNTCCNTAAVNIFLQHITQNLDILPLNSNPILDRNEFQAPLLVPLKVQHVDKDRKRLVRLAGPGSDDDGGASDPVDVETVTAQCQRGRAVVSVTDGRGHTTEVNITLNLGCESQF